MQEKINCGSCFTRSTEPKGCLKPCFHDALDLLLLKIGESTNQLMALLQQKIPDPPRRLVSSKEVCEYVGIASKTLLRQEKIGMIHFAKKDHTGKYYHYADMVIFKKKYHNLTD
ncbi:hypothetical protein [Sphingobacterium luzhongxinii]|uniref:hypothetical protein n=1 Tax=Sphingobacterium luzhongxinii TaxID=2654181 RepID=UPI0013D9E25D|nr:hypothetical protein [Sphingobacterium sp. xlx-73]